METFSCYVIVVISIVVYCCNYCHCNDISMLSMHMVELLSPLFYYHYYYLCILLLLLMMTMIMVFVVFPTFWHCK